MFPVTVLLFLSTAHGLVAPLLKTAIVNVNVQDTNSTPPVMPSSPNPSIPETIPVNVPTNADSKGKGCKNCARNPPTSKTGPEHKLRLEVIKQQILQGLQMTEPPKINRRDFNVPPPLLKKFQEAKERQKQKEEQPEETKTEVILLGNKVSLPNRSKWLTRKVKFNFHVSYKVYTTNVHAASLWVHLSKSSLRQKGTILTIKEIQKKAGEKEHSTSYAITKNLKEKNGGWVSIDVKKIVNMWKKRAFDGNMRETNQNQTLEITCSNCEEVNREAIGTRNRTRPFIVVDLVSVKSRKKRSIKCRPEIRSCCLQELYVSFAEMGWDNWILIPKGFKVNYCTGSCYGHILPVYSHSGLLQKVALQKRRIDMAPCCSPSKLSALSILYFDPYENILQQDIDNMTVEQCGCS